MPIARQGLLAVAAPAERNLGFSAVLSPVEGSKPLIYRHLHLVILIAILTLGCALQAQEESAAAPPTATPPPSPTLSPSAEAIFIRKNESLSLEEKHQMLQDLVNANPTVADVWTAYAEVLEEMGNDEKAMLCFQKATDIDPDAYTPWLWIGILAKRGNPEPDLEKAEMAFRKAIDKGAPKGRAYNELGVTLAIQGEFQDAVECFKRGLEAEPDWGVLYGNLLKAAVRMDDMELANQYIDGAIQAERFNDSAVLTYTDYVAATGDPRDTLPIYQKVIALHPENARLRYYHGLALGAVADIEGAEAEFEKTKELALKNPEEYAELVQAAEFDIFRLNHPKDEEEFQKARKLVFDQTASQRRMERNLEKAIKMLGPLIEEHPDFWNGYFVRGVAYRRIDDRENARADFNRVLELFEDEPNATMQLALMERDEYRFTEAADLAEKAVELAPRDPTFQVNAGLIMIEAGRCERAWDLYRNAVRMVGEQNCQVLLVELEARCGDEGGE